MKKIFFLAPMQKSSVDSRFYQQVIDFLSKKGYGVTSDYLFFDKAKQNKILLENLAFHKRFTKQLKKVDFLCVDVNNQRVSLGYYLALALEWGKPTIVLHKRGQKLNLLRALEENEKLFICDYKTIEDLKDELPMLLRFCADQQEIRFNFFISPKQQNFLNWVTKTERVPRSVFLRELIDKHMDANEEYIESP